MAAFSVTLDDAAAQRALAELARRIANPTPAMADIGRALGNLTEDAFQSETSPFGDGWQALTQRYVARPRNKGGRGGDAHPILQRDGGMAGSVTHGGDRNSAWVGVGKEYAAIHQLGGKPGMAPGPAAIPARPFLPVDENGALADAAKTEILDIIREWLDGASP